MKFYKLNVARHEYEAEGEDKSEWFTSLSAAVARRRSLIALNPLLAGHIYGSDFEIERYDITTNLSPQQLLLAVLNRKGSNHGAWYDTRATVMEEYKPE